MFLRFKQLSLVADISATIADGPHDTRATTKLYNYELSTLSATSCVPFAPTSLFTIMRGTEAHQPTAVTRHPRLVYTSRSHTNKQFSFSNAFTLFAAAGSVCFWRLYVRCEICLAKWYCVWCVWRTWGPLAKPSRKAALGQLTTMHPKRTILFEIRTVTTTSTATTTALLLWCAQARASSASVCSAARRRTRRSDGHRRRRHARRARYDITCVCASRFGWRFDCSV